MKLFLAQLAHVRRNVVKHLILLLGHNLGENFLASVLTELRSHVVGDLGVVVVVELGQVVTNSRHVFGNSVSLSKHVVSLVGGLDLGHVVLKLIDLSGAKRGEVVGELCENGLVVDSLGELIFGTFHVVVGIDINLRVEVEITVR